MIRAVGGVGVDEEVRVPLVEELDQAAGLGCLELDEVAVEVEAAGVGPLAHSLFGADLAGPVGLRDPLVAVGVVDRRHGQDHVLQQGRMRARRSSRASSIGSASLPQTSPAWMLPITRQTSLPERAASAAVLTGGSATINSGIDRPSDDRPSSVRWASGCRLGERLAPRGDVVIPRRRAIVAPFGDRLQRAIRRGNLGGQGQQ